MLFIVSFSICRHNSFSGSRRAHPGIPSQTRKTPLRGRHKGPVWPRPGWIWTQDLKFVFAFIPPDASSHWRETTDESLLRVKEQCFSPLNEKKKTKTNNLPPAHTAPPKHLTGTNLINTVVRSALASRVFDYNRLHTVRL